MTSNSTLMPAVILAGGLATRLKPLTETIPKALLPVAGRPFLEHQLELLGREGIREVFVLAGHLGERIQQTFGDGGQLGVSIRYSFDGPTLLGTGGAIRKALQLLPARFFVIYGDSYLTCSFQDVQHTFDSSGKQGLMTVYRNNDQFDASNVEFDGARIIVYDKKNRTPRMHHIDYGLGAFRREVFEVLPSDTNIDLATIYQDLLQQEQLAAFEVRERFYEIGSLSGLQETDEFLRRPGPKPET